MFVYAVSCLAAFLSGLAVYSRCGDRQGVRDAAEVTIGLALLPVGLARWLRDLAVARGEAPPATARPEANGRQLAHADEPMPF